MLVFIVTLLLSATEDRFQKVINHHENSALAEKLERGDLVFFYDSYTTSKFISHTGINLGENEFIHTSSSKGVIITNIEDSRYWGKRFLFGTRFK